MSTEHVYMPSLSDLSTTLAADRQVSAALEDVALAITRLRVAGPQAGVHSLRAMALLGEAVGKIQYALEESRSRSGSRKPLAS